MKLINEFLWVCFLKRLKYLKWGGGGVRGGGRERVEKDFWGDGGGKRMIIVEGEGRGNKRVKGRGMEKIRERNGGERLKFKRGLLFMNRSKERENRGKKEIGENNKKKEK